MTDPDSSILSHLSSAFVNSLLPEAKEYLATVPAKMGVSNVVSRYNPLTGNIIINPDAPRQELEEEALHALTIGMGTTGGGIGRGLERMFYPGSWFGFSDEEKKTLSDRYKKDKPFPFLQDILWLTRRGAESGPASWNLAGGDFSAMPQAAQTEIGQFFDIPPSPPLQYDAGYVQPSLKEVSQTPVSTPGPGSFLKVDQAPLPATRRYKVPKRSVNKPPGLRGGRSKSKPKTKPPTRVSARSSRIRSRTRTRRF